MRPEDLEKFSRMARDWEKIRSSRQQIEHLQKLARDSEKMRPRPEEIAYLQKIARDWEKLRPTLQQMESFRRQAELAQELFSDADVLQAHVDAGRISAQYNRALAQVPDAATQKALLESARYFSSRDFQAQRDAILQATQTARQRLGSVGLAAAERVAARRTAADGNQERAADRIRNDQGAALLEEATRLAASPEIRQSIESIDPEALVRLDEEQRSEAPIPEPATAETEVYAEEYPTFTKEELLEIHRQALLLLYPLGAALVGLALTNPAAPLLATLALTVGGLRDFVQWSEAMIFRWEDEVSAEDFRTHVLLEDLSEEELEASNKFLTIAPAKRGSGLKDVSRDHDCHLADG